MDVVFKFSGVSNVLEDFDVVYLNAFDFYKYVTNTYSRDVYEFLNLTDVNLYTLKHNFDLCVAILDTVLEEYSKFNQPLKMSHMVKIYVALCYRQLYRIGNRVIDNGTDVLISGFYDCETNKILSDKGIKSNLREVTFSPFQLTVEDIKNPTGKCIRVI